MRRLLGSTPPGPALHPVTAASNGPSGSGSPSTDVASDDGVIGGAVLVGRSIDGAVIPCKTVRRRRPGTSLPAGIVLALTLAIATAACSMGGCPTALATGTLAVQGEELVLRAETGETFRVLWPSGYSASTDAGGELVLTHVFDGIVARQGDTVNVGGGMSADDTTFQGCGELWVGDAGPP